MTEDEFYTNNITPPDDLIGIPIFRLALKLGERVCRLAKIVELKKQDVSGAEVPGYDEDPRLRAIDAIADRELKMVYAAKTALKCRMKDFVAFVQRSNIGKPLTDEWIEQNYILICAGVAHDQEQKFLAEENES